MTLSIQLDALLMIEFYGLPEPHHLGQRGSINYGNKTDNWFHTKILRETGSFELLEMRSEIFVNVRGLLLLEEVQKSGKEIKDNAGRMALLGIRLHTSNTYSWSVRGVTDVNYIRTPQSHCEECGQ